MCAINGVTEQNTDVVERMNAVSRRRGPDGTGIYADEWITLGHNRLSIIDLSDRAAQPMRSADGRYIIVYNGELYNFRELRATLSDRYRFVSEGDTEVLLAAYDAWGNDMFQKLRGIFAFAIWDTKEKELLLARDHMGVKPLYFQYQHNVLRFSSEVAALIEAEKTSTLDLDALSFFLTMQYVPSPKTLVAGIQKLAPGQALRFKNGSIHLFSFLTETPIIRTGGSAGIYETIDAAVKRQLISDRRVGAYLSGGFDSSIVLHHMTKHASEVRTYSVGFEMVKGEEGEAKKFNADASLAAETAKVYGATHTAFTVTLDDIRKTVASFVGEVDEPVANPTAVTQYLLSKWVREDGTVVALGGDGGDELFGGYTRHRHAMGAYLFQKVPRVLGWGAEQLYPRLRKLHTPFFTPFHLLVLATDEQQIAPILKKNLGITETLTRYFDEAYNNMPPGRHPVDVFMEVDRKTWLADECFIRVDHTTMANGLELRVPLCDLDVVQLADTISVWKKTLPHEGKRVIRNVYRPHLPQYLYTQPKRGWLSPAAKWFRDPVIHALVTEVFSNGYYDGLSAVFDWDALQRMLEDHVDKRGYHLYPLWNVFILQMWARTYNVRV